MAKNIYRLVKDVRYFDKVRQKMDRLFRRQCTVRFGEMGHGVHPNYQIESFDGSKIETFSGQTHKPHRYEEFEGDNITERISYEEIQSHIRSR